MNFVRFPLTKPRFDWFVPITLSVFCTFEDNRFVFVRSETATLWVTLFALLFKSTCCQKKKGYNNNRGCQMIHSLQWLCSFEFGLEPSFAASTRLLTFKPNASVGGEKKNMLSLLTLFWFPIIIPFGPRTLSLFMCFSLSFFFLLSFVFMLVLLARLLHYVATFAVPKLNCVG